MLAALLLTQSDPSSFAQNVVPASVPADTTAESNSTTSGPATPSVPVPPSVSAPATLQQTTTLSRDGASPLSLTQPDNPLALSGDNQSQPNAATHYDSTGHLLRNYSESRPTEDYRVDSPGATQSSATKLPYFGYNFFAPARQLIDARRAYLIRRYNSDQQFSQFPTTTGQQLRQNTPNGSNVGLNDMNTGPWLPSPQAGPYGNGFIPTGATVPQGATPNPYPINAGSMQGQIPTNTGNLPTQDAAALATAGALEAGSTISSPPAPDLGLVSPRTGGAYGTPNYPNGGYNYGSGVANGQVAPYGYASSPYSRTPYGGLNGYSQFGEPQPGQDSGNSIDASPANPLTSVVDPLTQIYSNIASSAPPTYQLSGGDTLVIRYWSPTMDVHEVRSKVAPDGSITVDSIGKLVVRGLTPLQAENVLRRRLQGLYRGADVTVTLGELRTISVTVSGDAYVPGSYAIPAASSVYNLLYTAGGPTTDGTLRKVQVLRDGVPIRTFDFYKFLHGGDTSAGLALQPGDTIYIPPRVSTITVRGEVHQPAIYELLDNETLQNALDYAGGIKKSGVAQHVQINTVSPGAARILKDVNLSMPGSAAHVHLYDGDVVNVFSVRSVLSNEVTVDGAVDQPGEYAMVPGMHVSTLIERARGTLYNAYTPRADLFRTNDDTTHTLIPINLDGALTKDPEFDIPLKRWDVLKVYSREQVAYQGNQQVTVRGPVQRPGIYSLSKNTHVSDLLLMVGGPTPEAYLNTASLLHQRGDGTFAYQNVDLAAILKGDKSKDIAIQDNDILAIYTTAQAHFEPEHTVSILGDVVSPGVYPRGQGMKLSDLLTAAGGFNAGAVMRVNVAHAYRVAQGDQKLLPSSSAIFDASDQTTEGSNIELKDGDVVTIQKNGSFVSKIGVVNVAGAVNRPGPITLTSKMRLSDVIREAGGLKNDAFPEGLELTRNPALLASDNQRSLTNIVIRLNDVLNKTVYNRALAVSDIDKTKAANSAAQPEGLSLGGSAPVISPAAGALSAKLADHDLVSPARVLSATELEANGNIAVDLSRALKHPGGPDDIPVVDGDSLVVPETPTTIEVIGAVFTPRGVLYHQGANLDYYVHQSGGYSSDAAIKQIEIIHAGGGMIPAEQVRELRPGDIILVPTAVQAIRLKTGGSGLDSFFRSLTNTALTLTLAKGLFKL